MSKDLHTYLTAFGEEDSEDVIHVSREVDPRGFDVSSVLQHLEDRGDQRVVRFKKTQDLNGRPTNFTLVYNLFATRELCARAIGFSSASAGLKISPTATYQPRFESPRVAAKDTRLDGGRHFGPALSDKGRYVNLRGGFQTNLSTGRGHILNLREDF